MSKADMRVKILDSEQPNAPARANGSMMKVVV